MKTTNQNSGEGNETKVFNPETDIFPVTSQHRKLPVICHQVFSPLQPSYTSMMGGNISETPLWNSVIQLTTSQYSSISYCVIQCLKNKPKQCSDWHRNTYSNKNITQVSTQFEQYIRAKYLTMSFHRKGIIHHLLAPLAYIYVVTSA